MDVVHWLTYSLPAVNACLNALSFVFLVLGYSAVRRGAIAQHRRAMLAALSSSTVFLVGYLTRMWLTGTHRFPGSGWLKTFYLSLLLSHMFLAVLLVPLVLRALYLALQQRFAAHKKITRWAWPIWLYVSVTGVIVYFMLYHVAPRTRL